MDPINRTELKKGPDYEQHHSGRVRKRVQELVKKKKKDKGLDSLQTQSIDLFFSRTIGYQVPTDSQPRKRVQKRVRERKG